MASIAFGTGSTTVSTEASPDGLARGSREPSLDQGGADMIALVRHMAPAWAGDWRNPLSRPDGDKRRHLPPTPPPIHASGYQKYMCAPGTRLFRLDSPSVLPDYLGDERFPISWSPGGCFHGHHARVHFAIRCW